MTTVGILSDNHGDWLDMEAIAPTTAVLGNTDGDMPINESAVVMLDGKKFFVQHIVDPHRLQASLRERLKRIEPDVVVFGHTHMPFCETLGGILFLNPGSVTQPRGDYRPSMVRLTIDHGKITPKFIEF